MTNFNYCSAIYEFNMKEDLRIIITRWRLSCFDLLIERGRYTGIPREDRLCSFCDVLEDECHVIFSCYAYKTIREQFTSMLQNNPTVEQILNPKDKDTATQVGTYLKLIEDKRKSIL